MRLPSLVVIAVILTCLPSHRAAARSQNPTPMSQENIQFLVDSQARIAKEGNLSPQLQQGLKDAEGLLQELQAQSGRGDQLTKAIQNFVAGNTNLANFAVDVRAQLASGTDPAKANAAFSAFSGNWYGVWDGIKVDHIWSPTVVTSFGGQSTIQYGNLAVSSLQGAWVGTGLGWNVVATPPGGKPLIFGSVTQFEGWNEKPGVGHVGILIGEGKLLWITKYSVYLEQANADKTYTISYFDYSYQNGQVALTKAGKATYTQDPNNRPAFQAYNVNASPIIPGAPAKAAATPAAGGQGDQPGSGGTSAQAPGAPSAQGTGAGTNPAPATPAEKNGSPSQPAAPAGPPATPSADKSEPPKSEPQTAPQKNDMQAPPNGPGAMAPARTPIGAIKSSSGNCTLDAGAKAVAAAPLAQGSVLMVPAAGHLSFKLNDGSEWAAGPQSLIRVTAFDADKQQTTIEMPYGHLLASGVPQVTKPGGLIQVLTPSSRVVALSNTFVVDAPLAPGAPANLGTLPAAPSPPPAPSALLSPFRDRVLNLASGTVSGGASGSLFGTVSGPTGAAVSRAIVSAKNDATGTLVTTRSDGSGAFSFPGLAPGSYSLIAQASGLPGTTLGNVGVVSSGSTSVGQVGLGAPAGGAPPGAFTYIGGLSYDALGGNTTNGGSQFLTFGNNFVFNSSAALPLPREESWVLNDNFNRIIGKHQFKTGVNYSYQHPLTTFLPGINEETAFGGSPGSYFNVNPAFTSGYLNLPPNAFTAFPFGNNFVFNPIAPLPREESWVLNDNWNRIIGKHQFKTGVNYSYQRPLSILPGINEETAFGGSPGSYFNVNPAFTGSYLNPPTNTFDSNSITPAFSPTIDWTVLPSLNAGSGVPYVRDFQFQFMQPPSPYGIAHAPEFPIQPSSGMNGFMTGGLPWFDNVLPFGSSGIPASSGYRDFLHDLYELGYATPWDYPSYSQYRDFLDYLGYYDLGYDDGDWSLDDVSDYVHDLAWYHDEGPLAGDLPGSRFIGDYLGYVAPPPKVDYFGTNLSAFPYAGATTAMSLGRTALAVYPNPLLQPPVATYGYPGQFISVGMGHSPSPPSLLNVNSLNQPVQSPAVTDVSQSSLVGTVQNAGDGGCVALFVNGVASDAGYTTQLEVTITGRGTSTGDAVEVKVTNNGGCWAVYLVISGTVLDPMGMLGRHVGAILGLISGVDLDPNNFKSFQILVTFGGAVVVPPAAVGVQSSGRLHSAAGELPGGGAPDTKPARNVATMLMRSYCLELHKLAPVPNTKYRFAAADLQQKLNGSADLMQRVFTSVQTGVLKVPQGHSLDGVIQWAEWALREGMDEKKFKDSYMLLVKHNYNVQKKKWDKAAEQLVESSGNSLWPVVQAALRQP
ncbi:MAG: carboxypeptidase regulatory-like domain-containing protein [Acidobacteria bacterium]|nr:carboxypeptidase regulatory-like domain-containing protein [Acidobacteriota bacterium]